MPRTVQISSPANKTDHILGELKQLDGLLGLRVLKGVSLIPEGDVISLEVTNRDFSKMMRKLSSLKVITDPGISITTNQPMSLISQSSVNQVTRDKSEAIWEEMQVTINKQSIMTYNSMFNMFLSGVIATAGILTNTLHIVIGAMVIAPGFEPIIRISLGLVSQHTDWKNGVTDTVKAYSSLFVGALLTALFLQAMGTNLPEGKTTYLPSGALINFWSTVTISTILIDIAASFAGAILIITHRSVLTGGVMIAFALIPATCLIAIGIISGDWSIAISGVLRLLLEMIIIAVCTAILFAGKKLTVHRRKMFG